EVDDVDGPGDDRVVDAALFLDGFDLAELGGVGEDGVEAVLGVFFFLEVLVLAGGGGVPPGARGGDPEGGGAGLVRLAELAGAGDDGAGQEEGQRQDGEHREALTQHRHHSSPRVGKTTGPARGCRRAEPILARRGAVRNGTGGLGRCLVCPVTAQAKGYPFEV